MVVLRQYNSTQFSSLQTIQGRVLFDTTLKSLRYNNATNYNNIIVAKDTSNNLTDINNITIGGNTNISNHNGSTTGLVLGGTLVTASAAQLNYNNVVAGTAAATSSLVLDANRNITNINTLSATTINTTQLNNLNLNTTGNVGINTSALTYGLEVNQATGKCLRLSYNNSNGTATSYANLTVSSTGTLSITAVGTAASVNIANHNGSTLGLQLAGTLVTSSAVQLNYANVVPGTASATAALVLDSSRNITNINNMTSTGTLTSNLVNVVNSATASTNVITAYQASLASAASNTISFGQSAVNYNAGQLVFNYVGSASTSNTVGIALYGQASAFTVSGLGNANIVNHNGSTTGLQLGGTLVTSTAVQLNYLNVTPGTAAVTSAVVLDASRNITNMNNITSTGIITLANTATASTTLISALESGLTTGLSNYVAFGQAATNNNSAQLAFNYVGAGSTSNSIGISLYGQASTFTMNGLGNVNIVNHNGSTTGLQLAGTLVTSTAAQLNYVNTTPGTAVASNAIVLDASRNITNMNNITSTGTVSSNLINVVNTATATTNLITAYQASLSTSTIDYMIFGQSATNNNSAQFGFNYAGSGSTSNLVGISLYGQTPALTVNGLGNVNIPTHNGTVGLSLAGTVVTSSAAQLNYNNVTPGTAAVSKALVLDATGSITGITNMGVTTLTASTMNVASLTFGTTYNNQILALYNGGSSFYGFGASATSLMYESYTAHTWYTATPNEASLPVSGSAGTQLMTLSTAGYLGLASSAPSAQMEINSTTGNCLKLTYNNSTGTGTNYAALTVSSTGTLSINATGTAASVNIANHNGTTLGLQLAGSLVTASATQLNYTVTTPGLATASKALVTDANNSIAGLNYIDAASAAFLKPNNANNTVEYPVNLLVYPGTVAGVGLGTGIQFSSVNDTNAVLNTAAINYVSSSITTGAESGFFDFRLVQSGTIHSAVTIANTGILSCTSLVETSDIREKENIQETQSSESLEKILKINVKTYNYIKDENKVNHTGVIAQELKEILPSAVVIRKNDDYDDFHQVHYTQMIPHLINCIKEFKNKVTQLKAEIAELKK